VLMFMSIALGWGVIYLFKSNVHDATRRISENSDGGKRIVRAIDWLYHTLLGQPRILFALAAVACIGVVHFGYVVLRLRQIRGMLREDQWKPINFAQYAAE